jgi:hypothetical protein
MDTFDGEEAPNLQYTGCGKVWQAGECDILATLKK